MRHYSFLDLICTTETIERYVVDMMQECGIKGGEIKAYKARANTDDFNEFMEDSLAMVRMCNSLPDVEENTKVSVIRLSHHFFGEILIIFTNGKMYVQGTDMARGYGFLNPKHTVEHKVASQYKKVLSYDTAPEELRTMLWRENNTEDIVLMSRRVAHYMGLEMTDYKNPPKVRGYAMNFESWVSNDSSSLSRLLHILHSGKARYSGKYTRKDCEKFYRDCDSLDEFLSNTRMLHTCIHNGWLYDFLKADSKSQYKIREIVNFEFPAGKFNLTTCLS